jgi:hypothetical protein
VVGNGYEFGKNVVRKILEIWQESSKKVIGKWWKTAKKVML